MCLQKMKSNWKIQNEEELDGHFVCVFYQYCNMSFTQILVHFI